MYRIEWKKELPLLLVLALLILVPCLLYQRLPAQMPVHWNLKGQVDHYLARTPLTALILPLLALGTYVLMLFFPYIDPKRQRYADFLRPYRIIRLALVLFFAGICGVVYASSLGIAVSVDRVIPAGVGLLFIVIGNFLGKVRRNWFLGIRLPWTLESEMVWNKTHRLGGRLMVLSGLCGVAGVLLPPVARFPALIVPLALTIIVTSVYSYLLFRKGQ